MKFNVFVENLKVYNEGHSSGEWVFLPISEEEVQRVKKRISLKGGGEPDGIINLVIETDFATNQLSKSDDLSLLNRLATKIKHYMTDEEVDLFCEILDSGITLPEPGVTGLINLTYNLNRYQFIDGAVNDTYLGKSEIGKYSEEQLGLFKDYIDWERVGRDIRANNIGGYTDNGYVRDRQTRWEYVFKPEDKEDA